MKKLMYVMLVIPLVLSACTPATVDDDPVCGDNQTLIDGVCVDDVVCDEGQELIDGDCVDIAVECSDTQIEVDGECVDLTGPELLLRSALETTLGIDNYTLDVTITDGADVVPVTLRFDGATTMYEDANETIYTTKDNDICTETTVRFEQVSSAIVPCGDGPYDFFEFLTYDMFTLESGVYHLNPEHLVDIAFPFLTGDAVASDFTVQVGDNRITSMTLHLDFGDDLVTITFDLSAIGTTEIELPVLTEVIE